MTKEERNAYMREYFKKRKENHMCKACGSQDERTLSGKLYCESCAIYENKRQGNRYVKLLSEKRCACCGKQDDRTLSGKVHCKSCAEKEKVNI